jgi:hypothetical protein
MMAQSKGARSKGGSLAVGGGTVNVVLSAATAKDLLTALSQAVGTGGKLKTKAATSKLAAGSRSKLAAPKARPKAAASRATSKGAAPKAGSRAAKPK